MSDNLYDASDPVANTPEQFVALHDTLNDPGSLPPKRILATTFVPSAWLDDALIAERKAGLSAYLTGLLQSPQFRARKFLVDFLTPSTTASTSPDFNLEDALPSTLSRKAALSAQSRLSAQATSIAAAYYPDWSSDSNPPNKLDFSKFDILLFGTRTRYSYFISIVRATLYPRPTIAACTATQPCEFYRPRFLCARLGHLHGSNMYHIQHSLLRTRLRGSPGIPARRQRSRRSCPARTTAATAPRSSCLLVRFMSIPPVCHPVVCPIPDMFRRRLGRQLLVLTDHELLGEPDHVCECVRQCSEHVQP